MNIVNYFSELQIVSRCFKSTFCQMKLNFCFGINILQVAEKIQEELEDYRSREDDIKRMKHDMGLEGGAENDAAIGMLSDNTQVRF